MSSPPVVPQSLARRRAEVEGPRLRRWEDATEWPLAVVGIGFLVAYAIPIAQPDVDPVLRSACSWYLGLTWVAFVVDYVVRVCLARRRWAYVRRHPLALAVVVLPVLRPLLLVSVVTRLNQTGRRRMRGKVVRYAAVGTVLLVLTGALVVVQAERGRPGATIQTLGDALWWAMVTITTVGYGDMAPVTPVGRTMAVVLMLGGIALLGVVTATLSSWLVEVVSYQDDDVDPDGVDPDAAGPGNGSVAPGDVKFADAVPTSLVSPEQIALLTGELRALRAELVDLRRRLPDDEH